MTYNLDLRKRVVEHVEKGGTKAEAARLFGVSLWCVNDLLDHYKGTNQ